MAHTARISLAGNDPKKIDGVAQQIKTIAERTGVRLAGPIPLPTRRLSIPVRKAPNGSGSETYDHWEMRIHKRLIDIDPAELRLGLAPPAASPPTSAPSASSCASRSPTRSTSRSS